MRSIAERQEVAFETAGRGYCYPSVSVQGKLAPGIGTVLMYCYFLMVVAKKVLQFDDGIVDVLLLGMALIYLTARLGRVLPAVKSLLGLKTTRYSLILLVYYLYLSVQSKNPYVMSAVELISVFKWVIYYFIGFLLGTQQLHGREFIPRKHIFFIASTVFAYSMATYNWSGFSLSYQGFYDNSFESIFSLRSVFAIYGFCLLVTAVNHRFDLRNLLLVLYSLTFIFMSGNRKMLVGLALIMLLTRPPAKFSTVLKYLKYVLLVLAVAVLPFTNFYEATMKEYTNTDQPRIFAYIKALEIASDYFPLAPGPGSFASKGSMVNYSDLYEKYGMSDKYGFREDDEVYFYNDTYWAQIIGQYGAIGCALVLLILFHMCAEANRTDELFGARLRGAYLIPVLVLLSISTPLFQRTEMSLFIFMLLGWKLGRPGALRPVPPPAAQQLAWQGGTR